MSGFGATSGQITEQMSDKKAKRAVFCEITERMSELVK